MNKKFLLPFLLSGLLIAGCSTSNNEGDPANNDPGNNTTNNNNNGSNGNNNQVIIRGHGAPNNNEGALYSLYVDEDTGKIYEKNKQYVPTQANSLVKFANEDDSKWIYTNSIAGDNFGKDSALATAIRTTLLSTNITLKASLTINTTLGGHPFNTEAITYLQYNFGNVLQKAEDDNHHGFEDSPVVGCSIYDVDNDSYRLFVNGSSGLEEHTEYITSSDPMERSLASGFVNKCLNNNIENTCNFALVDTILSELDNFTVNNQVYSLNKTISSTSQLYDQMYGENNYYMEFRDIRFKVNNDGTALDNFYFVFEYGNLEKTETMLETLFLEVSNLRTTSFDLPV